jgi:hypothetical protein
MKPQSSNSTSWSKIKIGSALLQTLKPSSNTPQSGTCQCQCTTCMSRWGIQGELYTLRTVPLSKRRRLCRREGCSPSQVAFGPPVSLNPWLRLMMDLGLGQWRPWGMPHAKQWVVIPWIMLDNLKYKLVETGQSGPMDHGRYIVPMPNCVVDYRNSEVRT